MPHDNPLHQGEPHAGALELRNRVQALKDAEELADVLHVEAHAVIADEVCAAVQLRPIAELDRGPRAWSW